MTKRGLATKLGVDPSTIYRWGSGRSRISAEDAIRLAEELDTTIERLMQEEEDR